MQSKHKNWTIRCQQKNILKSLSLTTILLSTTKTTYHMPWRCALHSGNAKCTYYIFASSSLSLKFSWAGSCGSSSLSRCRRPPLRSKAVRSHSLTTASISELHAPLVRRFSRTESALKKRNFYCTSFYTVYTQTILLSFQMQVLFTTVTVIIGL